MFLKLTGGQRPAGDRRGACDDRRLVTPTPAPTPVLAGPCAIARAAASRATALRAALFGGHRRRSSALAIFAVVFWLTWQLLDYEELGDYLVRLGLSWLFLTFLSFLAFSALVTSLSTFFLSEDLRLLLAAPMPRDAPLLLPLREDGGPGLLDGRRPSCCPVLLGIGLARCAGPSLYLDRGPDPRSRSC